MSSSNPLFPDRPPAVSRDKHIHFLHESVKIAHRALLNGRHPFGCVLVDGSGEVLFAQGNVDTLNHAEATVCRTAWSNLRYLIPPLAIPGGGFDFGVVEVRGMGWEGRCVG